MKIKINNYKNNSTVSTKYIFEYIEQILETETKADQLDLLLDLKDELFHNYYVDTGSFINDKEKL